MVEYSREDLEEIKPIYFPSECDISRELFLPVCKASHRFDCMSGYFSSEMFAELALPLANFFLKEGRKCRLLVSPSLTEKDVEGLKYAYKNNRHMLPLVFGEMDDLKSQLERDALKVMLGLIACGRLELRFVVMSGGMFHTKVWLFETSIGKLAIHGSSNATKSGLVRNFEQMAVSKSWSSSASAITVGELEDRFESFWDGVRNDAHILPLNKASIEAISSTAAGEDSEKSAKKIVSNYVAEINKKELKVPEWLIYDHGEYAHQGEAVAAWMKRKRGILEIATGGGKTLTSLICISKALESDGKAIVIISVPKVPLIDQWCEDVVSFGVQPVNASGLGTDNIVKELNRVRQRIKYLDEHVVLVITHDALKNERIQKAIGRYACKKALIADEVHNLGTVDFRETDLKNLDYIVGLSATPERQYDPEGTDRMFRYFGDVVYKFTLEDAIGKCLVKFKYYPHVVELSECEVEEWYEINQQIKKRGWAFESDKSDPALEILLVKRRRILECAENKVVKLKEMLRKTGVSGLKRSLIFCTDKDPQQLEDVNEFLLGMGVGFHQVTQHESRSMDRMRGIKNDFTSGAISVLTSKRVLDEGFNVPEIETAYLLASNTVRRQWIQRLGRTLRLSPKTGKKLAHIHDFVVIPPSSEPADADAKKIVVSEFERVKFFSELSLNCHEQGGGDAVMEMLIEKVKSL